MERRVTGSDSVIVEEGRSVEADHVGEDVRNVLLEMGSEEQADSLNEEEVSIFHYYRNCRSEKEAGVGGGRV